MTKVYAIEWRDSRTGETCLCEVEGDVCYESYRTLEKCEAACAYVNGAPGDRSTYRAVELPHGLRPYFCGEGNEQPDPPYYG